MRNKFQFKIPQLLTTSLVSCLFFQNSAHAHHGLPHFDDAGFATLGLAFIMLSIVIITTGMALERNNKVSSKKDASQTKPQNNQSESTLLKESST